MTKIKNLFLKLAKDIVDENKRDNIQLQIILGLFAIISGTFSIFNIISKAYALMIATASFCILCIINILIIRFLKKGTLIAKLLFEIEILFLFSYFVISGGIEGFSIVWLLILPTCGMLFFGKKHGIILSMIMYLILILLLYLPLDFVYNYSKTFRLRFPFVYLASTAISFFLELVRSLTHNELVALQQKYEHLYAIDALTGAYNRYGFTNSFNKLLQMDENTKIGLCIMDIDDFKKVNDTYGHLVGDEVLRTIASSIRETITSNNDLFRWGGEEFAVLFHDIESGEAITTCEMIRKNIAKLSIKVDDIEIKVTISLGLIITKCLNDKTELETRLYTADQLLYEAKQRTGKNCLKYHDYTN